MGVPLDQSIKGRGTVAAGRTSSLSRCKSAMAKRDVPPKHPTRTHAARMNATAKVAGLTYSSTRKQKVSQCKQTRTIPAQCCSMYKTTQIPCPAQPTPHSSHNNKQGPTNPHPFPWTFHATTLRMPTLAKPPPPAASAFLSPLPRRCGDTAAHAAFGYLQTQTTFREGSQVVTLGDARQRRHPGEHSARPLHAQCSCAALGAKMCGVTPGRGGARIPVQFTVHSTHLRRAITVPNRSVRHSCCCSTAKSRPHFLESVSYFPSTCGAGTTFHTTNAAASSP